MGFVLLIIVTIGATLICTFVLTEAKGKTWVRRRRIRTVLKIVHQILKDTSDESNISYIRARMDDIHKGITQMSFMDMDRVDETLLWKGVSGLWCHLTAYAQEGTRDVFLASISAVKYEVVSAAVILAIRNNLGNEAEDILQLFRVRVK